MRHEPAIARWFLKFFCSGKEYESITGDLAEQYQTGRGTVWYCRQVLDIVCLALYSKAFRRPLARKDRLPIGQGIGLIVLFAVWSATFVSLASVFLLVLLALALGGVIAFVWINSKSEAPQAQSAQPVSTETVNYHPGISMQHIPVEGAVGLLFVVATCLIFFLGIPAIREILVVTLPLGILGGTLLLHWHKDHPRTIQRLGLKSTTRDLADH